jgi:hypothetical protein
VRFGEETPPERFLQFDEPVTADGDDAEIVWSSLAALELAAAPVHANAVRDDSEVGLDDLRELDDIRQDGGPPSVELQR